MRAFVYTIVLLTLFAVTESEARSNLSYTKKINDYSQHDLRSAMPNYTLGGFCAPTAASNIMRRFHEPRRVDQVEIIKKLASEEYMNTIQGKGTSQLDFLRGIERYMREEFLQFRYIKYQGPFKLGEYRREGTIPNPHWIIEGIGFNRGAFLSVWLAKYDQGTNTYNLVGGHMVTVTGYIIDKDQIMIVINDGADSSQNSSVYLYLEQIKDGKIVRGGSMNAAGFWKTRMANEQDSIKRYGYTVQQHKPSYATQGYDTLIIQAAFRIHR